MTDEVVATPEPVIDPSKLDIADFIVASEHIDKINKSTLVLGHRNDYVTVAVTQKAADNLAVPLSRLIVRFNFRRIKNGVWKTNVNQDMNSNTAAVSVMNDEQKGGADVNVQVSIVSASLAATEGSPSQTVQPAGGIVDLAPEDSDKGGGFPWVWVAALIAVGIFAAIVWRYFIAGKVIFGQQMPGPFIKGKLGQAPAAAAVTPAAPAPAPGGGK